MQIATFYNDVANALGRGNSLAQSIPAWTRAAVSFLESGAHNLSFMRKSGNVTTTPEAENPNIISFPNARIKSFDYIRYGKDGTWVYLIGTDPQGIGFFGAGMPEAYYHDGVAKIYLDKIPTEPLTLEVAWREFTDWPTNESSEPLWLTRGYTALLGQVFINASVALRDDDLRARGSKLRDEGISVLIAMEEELQHSGQSLRMLFRNVGT